MTLNHDYWITLGYFKQIRKIMIGIVMSHNSNMITGRSLSVSRDYFPSTLKTVRGLSCGGFLFSVC